MTIFIVFPTPPPEWLVFQPLDQVAETVNPPGRGLSRQRRSVSGLIALANYDRPTQDNVKVLFGAGCVQSILYSLCQEEAGGDTCYLGLTDPSALAAHPPQNCSPFSLPYHRFLELEGKVEESFLTTETWKRICHRISRKL